MSKEIIIEKMMVDIYATQQNSPNQYLVEIANYLQNEVLPSLDKALLEKLATGIDEVQIDAIDLKLDIKNAATNTDDLAAQIVANIVAQIEEKQASVNLQDKVRAELEQDQMAVNGLLQILEFLQSGVGAMPASKILKKDATDFWLEKLRNNVTAKQALIAFLIKNKTARLRFIRQFSTEIKQVVLTNCLSANFSTYLLFLIENARFNIVFREEILTIALKSNKFHENDFYVHFESWIWSKTDQIRTEIAQFLKKSHENTPINNQFTLKLMNALHKDSHHYVTALIREKSPTDLFTFINYLRSDYAFARVANPALNRYFQLTDGTDQLTNWAKRFAKELSDEQLVEDLLIELEELNPIRPDREGTEWYSTETNALINELEEQLTQIKTTKVPAEQTKNEWLKPEKEKWFIPTAGIVLLNPFLPALFSNLHLFTDKKEWKSENHQALAIYLLNYLVTERFDRDEADEILNESAFLLNKVLVGFPLDDSLPNWDELVHKDEFDIAQITEQLTIEKEGILKAVQENWRPMRNCTWQGLINDFLSRPGELETKGEKNYLLTPEPHALDVLLPHKNWGMSMIKYSWMEEMLYVEWEK